MKTIILANGLIRDYTHAREALKGSGYVIACDGGLRHATALGIVPDCLLGDMDSVMAHDKNAFTGRVVPFPAEKDSTDLELAMEHAIDQGAASVVILGALGGRIDHEIANVHVLTTALEANIPAVIKDERTCIRLMNREITICREGSDTVSLIPLTTEVTGVTTRGLYYPLRGESLQIGTTRGVSNRFTEETAHIIIDGGLLLVICVEENKLS
jgi:thiamine pyrophosphokinase